MSETGVVQDVRVRNLPNDKQIYIVRIEGKEYQTWRRDIAASAKSLINQHVNFATSTQQKGDFTNHYLDSIEPASAKQTFAEHVDQKQTDIRRAVAVKAAITMLPYFPSEQQNWVTVTSISPGIYQFLYGDDGNWDTSLVPDVAGQMNTEDVPF